MSDNAPEWSESKWTGVTHIFKRHGRNAYCGKAERASMREWKRSRESASVVCLGCARTLRRPAHTLAVLGVY